MHVKDGVRDPARTFPLPSRTDDAAERRQANRAIAAARPGWLSPGSSNSSLR
jgi:hypothetical protein